MTIYQKFEELITTYKVEVLDSPEWCKAYFRKAGMTEDDLQIRFFFMLLDKNTPLEIRKIAHRKMVYTDYGIAIAVYSKIFDSLTVPNVCEEVLIQHIIGMLNVFKKNETLDFECIPALKEKEFISELEPAINKMLEHNGTAILSNPEKVAAYLKDISGNEISDFERNSFVIFITALNASNVLISEKIERNIFFIKLLTNALEQNNLTYEPLIRNQERNRELEEKHGIFRDRKSRIA